MDGGAVLSVVAQACPSTSGRQFSVAASEYAKLAGLLAGFAFTGLVFILRERVSPLFARAVEVLVFAFFGLLLSSANYAIIAGEEPDYSAGRAVSEGVFAGQALTVSTVLVLYAIVLLLDAVEGSTDGSADTTDASATGRVEDEGDFGRVKRHLSAIIATFLTFFLILMVAHQTRIYADVTDRAGVDVIGGFVVAVQFVLSAAVGIAYLVHRRWVRRPLATNWRGASRFGLLSVGFVLISTLLCQWAGTIPSCDQIHWLVLAGAVAAHGAIIGYATIVIGRPWLRLQGS